MQAERKTKACFCFSEAQPILRASALSSLPVLRASARKCTFAADMGQRYFMFFSYDGTRYHGWQIQPHDISVQEVMTERMRCLFGPDFSLTGAGRTDAGVHARQMVAHFDLNQPLENSDVLVDKLNSMFPDDIVVHGIRPVKSDAHARFDALSRTYEYTFDLGKNPFMRLYATRLTQLPDVAAMNEAASVLSEYQDFTSFSKVHTDVKTFICKIFRAEWRQSGSLLIFTIEADRFLRNMVRAIVGTMLEVGRHKMDIQAFRQVIEQKNRCSAGTSMPPQGLCLTGIRYPEDLYEQF